MDKLFPRKRLPGLLIVEAGLQDHQVGTVGEVDEAVFLGDLLTMLVPDARLWVMGDHRSESADSRAHLDEAGRGTIPQDEVVGRAFVIVWPPSRADVLPVPATFRR